MEWVPGEAKTDLFHRITNSDTRTHLLMFHGEECCDYLMSRRESLVGWKAGIKPGKLAASSSTRKCQIKCVLFLKNIRPHYTSMCLWLMQMNFASTLQISCLLMLALCEPVLINIQNCVLAWEKPYRHYMFAGSTFLSSLLCSNFITELQELGQCWFWIGNHLNSGHYLYGETRPLPLPEGKHICD